MAKQSKQRPWVVEKNGECSVDGSGEIWRGSEDDLTAWSPDTNPRLAEIARINALRNHGFVRDDKIIKAECYHP